MSILRKTSIAILAGLFITGIGSAQEKKIKRSDLPPAVEKTVAEASKGATIKGFSEETEKGKTTYEVEMVVNGHTKDVEMDASGAVLETEEEVATDSLSADVKAGLTTKAAGGKMRKSPIARLVEQSVCKPGWPTPKRLPDLPTLECSPRAPGDRKELTHREQC